MAQTEAQKAKAAEERQARKDADKQAREVRIQDPEDPSKTVVLEHLELVPETGVVLDTTDPNYESQKELEQLRAEVRNARQELLNGTTESSAKIDAAQQEVEKVRLRAELKAIKNQQAARGGGVAAVMDQVQSQQAEADSQLAAQQAAQTEGN